MQPFEIVQHEAGTEADGVPFLEVTVNLLGVLPECRTRPVEFAIVMEVVNAHLEPEVRDQMSEVRRDGVGAFGDEVEGGVEAEALFEFHQGLYASQTFGAFDVMGEDDGKLFAIGPTGPAGRRLLGALFDGPKVTTFFQKSLRRPTPHGDAQDPREDGLELVV
jgi:hypothetical protein